MAGSKPTAVHFSLVFFVMTTLILSIVTYLTFQEQKKAALAAADATDKMNAAEGNFKRQFDELAALKELMGYEGFEEIGIGGNNENSVIGAAKKDLVSLGRDQVQPSPTDPKFRDTLQSLRASLETMSEQSKTYNTGLNETNARLEAEKTATRGRENQLQQSQEKTEQEHQKLITDQTEKMAAKDAEIATVRQELSAERVAKGQLNDELDRVRRQTSEEISLLQQANQFLRLQLDKLENQSFDKPDGKIVRVDNTTRLVWIDIGSKDYLRPQTTFSVYIQTHRGVGRGSADIKAKVEVNKILGPNLAECRIVEEDFDRPIQAGDPVYSPLFNPGVVESFSFVGILDMDDNGKSDRELLHGIISNAGASVEVEVDDQGNRIPEGQKMSVKTKYLVVGDIPDPSQFPGADERREFALKISEEHKALEKEALQFGIKIVRFSDFLNYIGYENKQRLYVAGENQKYNLKSGSRSTGTDEVLGASRLSSGQTSQRFRSDRGNKKPASSTGQ
ncbi:hypothetical protein [Thalassoglobus polymorphus]|uniref:Uncharacterized protein n=1 Tax=Thalassoglobus polymorphus TaxID=2527994 RepID=A0A517QHE8_9PLAN|nr:hypothetical protein [Thalassoglobus polymorphus]QDT31035.1 hypothetical protein Mal48_02650 [Thalassoglobus polymorphus]